MAEDSILRVHGLQFNFGSSQILHGISFSVRKGTICGLLGPNASGKTTLLKCINGLLAASGGYIDARGERVGRLSRTEIARIMAVVPQQTHVVFSFTVLDIVVMGRAPMLENSSSPGKKEYEGAQEILEHLKISHLATRYFNQLSGGEKQMVLLARALYQNPQILLLDEPTSHLDFKNQFLILDMVRLLTIEKELTTLITLHDPNLANRYCDQVIMLRKGALLQNGLSQVVMQAENLAEVYDMEVSVESTNKGQKVIIPAKKQKQGRE